MDIKYRYFKTSDSKVVAELIHNLYREYPGDKSMLPQKIQNTFDSLSQHPDYGKIMILEHEKEVIGYAMLINFWSNEFGGNIINIDELYIRKEFRSQGIGTNFIKHLVKNKFGNSVALELEVTPSNKRARKLYESLGFKLYKNNTLILELG